MNKIYANVVISTSCYKVISTDFELVTPYGDMDLGQH